MPPICIPSSMFFQTTRLFPVNYLISLLLQVRTVPCSNLMTCYTAESTGQTDIVLDAIPRQPETQDNHPHSSPSLLKDTMTKSGEIHAEEVSSTPAPYALLHHL